MRFGMRAWVGGLTAVLALTLAGAAASCGRKAATSAPAPTPARVLGPEHRFAIKVGDRLTSLRLAVHDSERSRGLMGTASMPENEGMLFVWPKPQLMSFYMRNVPIPLEIGFFDPEGVLREIYPMYPGVEDSVLSRSNQLQLALEMNHGWFARNHVPVGATIDLAAVRDALKQRGYDPEKFLPER